MIHGGMKVSENKGAAGLLALLRICKEECLSMLCITLSMCVRVRGACVFVLEYTSEGRQMSF